MTKIVRVRRRYVVTKEDTKKVREIMREKGIKGTVRKGTGSTKYWIYVKTTDERIIDAIRPLGFYLLFRPNEWDKAFTFEKGSVEVYKVTENELDKFIRQK